MNLHLTLSEEETRFIESQVATGAFSSPEAAIHAALGLLAEELAVDDVDEDAALRRFLDEVQIGLDQLDRGEFVEVTDVKSWLQSLGRRPDAA
jgi:Arc/MetJ-type ribon-helix-helix transcriptional regulator